MDTPWTALIPDDQWDVLMAGADAMSGAGVEFLLGGALALAHCTGRWRNTKDIDVIVRGSDAPRAVEALKAAKFDDYYDQEPYDRSWIFRGIKDGTLFDVLWTLPNHRVDVDEGWFERARPLRLHDRDFRVVGPEELVRVKLYVMQRTRCDWVDVLNMLAAGVGSIDWDWLVQRMGRDLPLLHAALAVFNWMSPGRARELPRHLRERFALPEIEVDDAAAMEERRVRLFDSRSWFSLHQPADRPLER